MHTTMRKLALGLALTISPLAASLPAQATNPFVGTWKLDVAKPKCDPGPPPKSLTVTIDTAGQGVKVTAKGTACSRAMLTAWCRAYFDRT